MATVELNSCLKRMIDTAPLTYERSLVIGLIHSFHLYRQLKPYLCPMDERRGIARHDFVTPRYNVLYECIRLYWSMLEPSGGSPNPIPRDFLKAFIIDASNQNRMHSDMAKELLQELDEDLYINADPAFIKAIGGPVFAHWLDTRLSKKVIEDLANKSKNFVLTSENVEEMMAKTKHLRPNLEDRSHNAGDLMTSKIKYMPRLRTSLITLDAVLGGGYAAGESTLIAGTNGAGKTVISCQLAYDFIMNEYKVAYVTTEQRPIELIARMASNHLSLNFDQFTNRQDVKIAKEAREDTEVSALPEWLWTDDKYGPMMEELRDKCSRNFFYMDWSDGAGLSVPQNFDSEIESIEAKGFSPHVIIFDWIGGGLDKTNTNIDLRLLYQQAADHLIDHAKRKRRVMIALAQLDKVKALNRKKCGASMLSECKTMSNNMTNFVGISALMENDASDRAWSRTQYLYAEKTRNGETGCVPVERHFNVQRFVPKLGLAANQR